MTTSQRPPRQRTQRRIVVTGALLLLALAWWFYPRADARFVGLWAAYPTAASTQRGGTFHFQRNGSGWFNWAGATYFTVWDTSDGSLHFGLRFAESRLVNSIKSITGHMTWMTTMQYDIEHIDADSITLRNGPTSQPTLVLRRIPD